MKKFHFVKSLYSLLAAILLLAGTLVHGQPGVSDYEKLDRYYQQVLDDWNLPGMAIGIVVDGELVFSKGYGLIEVGRPGAPNEHTLFAIASNSKAITAAVLATLVDEGKITWDDKAKDHLPYFELFDHYVTNEATIRDLLSHRIGLGTFSGDVIWYKSDIPAEQVVRNARHLPRAFPFRSGYGYSNLMYLAAGEIIEAVTGKSWMENVEERILWPLGMSRTILRTADLAGKGNFATPHALIDGVNVPIEWEDWTHVAAIGGLISSVHDVAQWMILNMNHGIHGQDTLISRQSLNLMWTPHNSHVVDHGRQQDFNRHFNGYGLGWSLSDYHGRLSVGHTGGYDGMISEVRMLPKERIGVVVLTNGVKSPIGAITNYTLESLLGMEPRDWSAQMLPRAKQRWEEEDPRVTAIKNARAEGTSPSLPLADYAGVYESAIYGEIRVNLVNGQLELAFEHAEELAASLSHWHHDVWEIRWKHTHAFFGFGTVSFRMDNKRQVTGMDIEVPNRDIFFEELKPVRVR